MTYTTGPDTSTTNKSVRLSAKDRMTRESFMNESENDEEDRSSESEHQEDESEVGKNVEHGHQDSTAD